jgi:hypothetical protein
MLQGIVTPAKACPGSAWSGAGSAGMTGCTSLYIGTWLTLHWPKTNRADTLNCRLGADLLINFVKETQEYLYKRRSTMGLRGKPFLEQGEP